MVFRLVEGAFMPSGKGLSIRNGTGGRRQEQTAGGRKRKAEGREGGRRRKAFSICYFHCSFADSTWKCITIQFTEEATRIFECCLATLESTISIRRAPKEGNDK